MCVKVLSERGSTQKSAIYRFRNTTIPVSTSFAESDIQDTVFISYALQIGGRNRNHFHKITPFPFQYTTDMVRGARAERKEDENGQKKTWQCRTTLVAVAVLFDSGHRRFGYFTASAIEEVSK